MTGPLRTLDQTEEPVRLEYGIVVEAHAENRQSSYELGDALQSRLEEVIREEFRDVTVVMSQSTHQIVRDNKDGFDDG